MRNAIKLLQWALDRARIAQLSNASSKAANSSHSVLLSATESRLLSPPASSSSSSAAAAAAGSAASSPFSGAAAAPPSSTGAFSSASKASLTIRATSRISPPSLTIMAVSSLTTSAQDGLAAGSASQQRSMTPHRSAGHPTGFPSRAPRCTSRATSFRVWRWNGRRRAYVKISHSVTANAHVSDAWLTSLGGGPHTSTASQRMDSRIDWRIK
mmetsp:Transcript_5007/g.12969  ORF Transcript_5007/g.12969 Transcript_5007/m.12969 type:complete len:212 (-) Transcript_5007:1684-2319(-)